MSKFTVLASAGLAIALTAAAIVPAEAGARRPSTSILGSNGHGATNTRAATDSDGAHQSSSQTSFNNGGAIRG